MHLLTAIFLTYNHESTVSKAMDSILAQETNFDFVIHVLDDCSTDRTAEICEAYAREHPGRIEVFRNAHNLGVMDNLKQGLLRVRTRYFSFLEGDDFWCDSSKLQQQVTLLENQPGCTLCGHDVLCKDTVNNKEWLLSRRSKATIKSRYSITDDFRVHPSSRVYRNVVDFNQLPSFMVLDTLIYLVFLSKGDLCYINRVMSVYHYTGIGFWSGLTRRKRALTALDLHYKANVYLKFAYDYKFYPRAKLLRVLKSLLGVEKGWWVFFHLEKLRIYAKYALSGRS